MSRDGLVVGWRSQKAVLAQTMVRSGRVNNAKMTPCGRARWRALGRLARGRADGAGSGAFGYELADCSSTNLTETIVILQRGIRPVTDKQLSKLLELRELYYEDDHDEIARLLDMECMLDAMPPNEQEAFQKEVASSKAYLAEQENYSREIKEWKVPLVYDARKLPQWLARAYFFEYFYILASSFREWSKKLKQIV